MKHLCDVGCSLREVMAISRHSSKAVLAYMEGVESVVTSAIAARTALRIKPIPVLPFPRDHKSFLLKAVDQWRCIDACPPYAFFAINTMANGKAHAVLCLSDFKSKCGYMHASDPLVDVVKVLPPMTTKLALCSTCFGKQSIAR